MELHHEGIDDLLMDLYQRLLDSRLATAGTRGRIREELGVSIVIADPRARLSRSESRGKPFSAAGEFLWYLSRSDNLDFIRRYIPDYARESDDGLTVHGAYGPRLFGQRGHNQVENVATLLRQHPSSKRAVIQLFNAEDIETRHTEVPCTTTAQFMIREGALHLFVTLRSNDAYKGLPHDVFCFTMLQEMMARRLGVALGEYRQYVASMHLYDEDLEKARLYLEEGFQRKVSMPEMPAGNPFQVAHRLLEAERRVRAGEVFEASGFFAEAYWADIVRLLQVFQATGDAARLDALKAEFANPAYRAYLEGRRDMRPRAPDAPVQPDLRF